MKIVILDAKTLGDDIEFSMFNKLGDVSVYQTTSSLQLKDRIKDADIIIVNKIKLNKDNLTDAKKLKLICVTATGYDNIPYIPGPQKDGMRAGWIFRMRRG